MGIIKQVTLERYIWDKNMECGHESKRYKEFGFYILVGVSSGSAISLSFKIVTNIFLQHLSWNIGSHHNILIGIDLILGTRNLDMIPEKLLIALNRRGIF